MNKTKIEWCDSTWNPVTGCHHGCPYCYARGIARRFGGHTNMAVRMLMAAELMDCGTQLHVLDGPLENGASKAAYPFGFEPTLYRYRLGEIAKKKTPQTIFVCSMADLFGAWVPTSWIKEVLDACLAAPQHRYLFLTKNPTRYEQLDELALLPRRSNFWYGTTVEKPLLDMCEIPFGDSYNKFVSIEPLMGQFGRPHRDTYKDIGWFIIGAETGSRKGKTIPEKAWVQEIVDYCRATFKPVFMKDSLIPIIGEENMIRQYPVGL